MAQNLPFHTFNRGLVSRLGLAREDIKRIGLAAEEYVNWMPRVLGSMSLRPGLGYLGSSYLDKTARYLPFIFSTSDKALVELTDGNMRVWVNDALVTRPAVTSTLNNGTFDFDINSWLSYDEVGGVSSWAAGGFMQFLGDGTGRAIRGQAINVIGTNVGRVHSLNIAVDRGPIGFRVGSTLGGDEYISETTLDTGAHSIAFVPTTTAYVQFFSSLDRIVRITECSLAAAGIMFIAAPWAEASLGLVRFDQSGDILFVACKGYQQWKIERRSNQSWSVVKYLAEDGPFRIENVTPITLAPTTLALFGNISIASSKPVFKAGHVGAIFSMTSSGQKVAKQASAQNVFTDAVRVTGVGADRTITYNIGNVFVGTWTVQQSFVSATGPWIDTTATGTVPTIATLADGLDNQIVWYRLGVKTGNYTSGTFDLNLSFPMGSITGIFRVLAFQSNVLVDVEILKHLGDTAATNVWAEGRWSDFRGWPTSVAFHDGRLGWAGRGNIDLSVSDAFYSFDATIEGDSAPLSRSIGSGPVDSINWMMSLQRLLLGGEGAEFSCKSSALDEPLTPTNFNMRRSTTQGSSPVSPCEADSRGIFVQRGGSRVFELSLDAYGTNYDAHHLTALIPDIGLPGIVRMDIQRQPDTRVHCVRADGTVALMVYDRIENVICWVEVNTQGSIEDVVVLPGSEGDEEDQVYYLVKRTVNGSTQRFLERWARASESRGAAISLLADSFIHIHGSPASVTGLDHLEGMSVVVYADGIDYGTDAEGAPLYQVHSGTLRTIGMAPGPLTVTPVKVSVSSSAGWAGAGSTPGYDFWFLNWETFVPCKPGSGQIWVMHYDSVVLTVYWNLSLLDAATGNVLVNRAGSTFSVSGFMEMMGVDQVDGSSYTNVNTSGAAPIYRVTPANVLNSIAPAIAGVAHGGCVATAATNPGFDRDLYVSDGSHVCRISDISWSGGTCVVNVILASSMTRFAKNGDGIAGRIYYSTTDNSIRYIDKASQTEVIVLVGAFTNAHIIVGYDGNIYGRFGTFLRKYDKDGVLLGSVDVSGGDEVFLYDTLGYIWTNSSITSPPVATYRKIRASDLTIVATFTDNTFGSAHISGEPFEGVPAVDGAPFFAALGGSVGLLGTPDIHFPFSIVSTDVVVGLPYCARWKSGKLVELQSRAGTALTGTKSGTQLGLILADTHPKGLQYGPSFDRMDDLATVHEGAILDQNATLVDYDSEPTVFPGEWSSDERLCLRACAPRSCTVLAAILITDHHE